MTGSRKGVRTMYLTYDQFLYSGGQDIGEAAFGRHEYRARRLIDTYTHGRLQAEKEPRECVRRLMVELVELFRAESDAMANGAAAGIRSVSNDGVSVSYSGDTSADTNRTAGRMIVEYLADETDTDGVYLLYAGVE